MKHIAYSPSNLKPNEVQVAPTQPPALCLKVEIVIIIASPSLRADPADLVTEEDNRGLDPQHTADRASKWGGLHGLCTPFPGRNWGGV